MAFQFGKVYSQSYIHPQATDPGFIGETEHFMFYNHLWLNMHHFLYNSAIVFQEEGISSAISRDIWNVLTPGEREIMQSVLGHYTTNFAQEDLRTGKNNFEMNKTIVRIHSKEELPVGLPGFEAHFSMLNQFRPIYEKHYWKTHRTSNMNAYLDNIGWLTNQAARFIAAMENYCQATWQSRKIRVDISYVADPDGAYNTIRPVPHVVMGSKYSKEVRGEWFELLIHESSHHLVSQSNFIDQTIEKVAASMRLEAPPDLWHATLHYLSGRATWDILKKAGVPDYRMYMVRKNLYPQYFDLLDTYLRGYMSGDLTYPQYCRKILAELNR